MSATQNTMSDETKHRIMEMWNLGFNIGEIGETFGYSRQWVTVRLKEMRELYGRDVVPRKDDRPDKRRSPLDGKDHNVLYDDVPWFVRITGRDQRVGIPM